MFNESPKARAVLYWVAFVASALALFAVLIPGVGVALATAFAGLAALAQTFSSATALSNISRPEVLADELPHEPISY